MRACRGIYRMLVVSPGSTAAARLASSTRNRLPLSFDGEQTTRALHSGNEGSASWSDDVVPVEDLVPGPARAGGKTAARTKKRAGDGTATTAADLKSRKTMGKKQQQESTITGTRVTKAGRKSLLSAAKKDKEEACSGDEQPLGLELALPRRLDWTPPKPSNRVSMIDLTGDSPVSDEEDAAAARLALGEMLGRYSFGQEGLENDAATSDSAAAASASKTRREKLGATAVAVAPPFKRRKLDLLDLAPGAHPKRVTTPKTAKEAKKAKEKSPKKKAPTITELATKSFAPNEATQKPSLLEEFLSQAAVQRSSLLDTDDDNSVLVKATASLRKRIGDTRVQRTRKNKATVASRVLAPDKAIEALDQHDLLFGTSSQLVREESPTFIRDLQHALRESEASVDQEESASGTHSDSQLGRSLQGRSLWQAATRDLDGSLLEPETIDLTKTPKLGGSASTRTSSLGAFKATPAWLAPSEPSNVMASGVTTAEASGHFAPNEMDAGTSIALMDYETPVSLPRSIAEAACRPRNKSPTKRNPSPEKRRKTAAPPATTTATETKTKKGRARPASSEENVTPGKIDYNTWTVAELSKKIKSYGFKAVKGKTAMVALLERCSANANADVSDTISRQVLQPVMIDKAASNLSHHLPDGEVTVHHTDSAAGDSSLQPMKKRGRPRKTDVLAENAGDAAAVSSTVAMKAGKVRAKKTKALPASDVKGKSSLEALPDAILVTSSPPSAAAGNVAGATGGLNTEDPSATGTQAGSTKRSTKKKLKDQTVDESSNLALRGKIGTAAGKSDKVYDSEAVDEIDIGETDGAAFIDETSEADPNAHLLAAITQAVLRCPPTHDPNRPSWHEKMLMYDPIVLEDLTVWLNTEGLGRQGVDDEVWPTLVRQWCEERSVCCLWRENLRGGTRSRY